MSQVTLQQGASNDDILCSPCASSDLQAFECGALHLASFKVDPCPRITKNHDTTTCPFYHHQHDRRRPLDQFSYEPDQCEQHFLDDENSDAASGRACPNGDNCQKCHTVVELLYHPSVYKRRFCLHMGRAADRCPRGSFCAFAHSRSEIADPASIYSEEDEQSPTNEFFLYRFKTQWCPLSGPHDWNTCIYAHTKKDLRRTPLTGYAPRMCVAWERSLKGDCSGARKAYDACCPDGIECRSAHGLKELLYHPQQYKTRMCTDPTCNGQRRKVCAFAHDDTELRRPQKIRGSPCTKSVIEKEQPYFWSPLVFTAARARQLEECVRAPTCTIRTPSPEPLGYDMMETTPVREIPKVTLVPPGSIVAQPVPGFAAIPVLFSPPESSTNSPQLVQCVTPPSPKTPTDENNASCGPNMSPQNHKLWLPTCNGMAFVASEPTTPARVARSPQCGVPSGMQFVRSEPNTPARIEHIPQCGMVQRTPSVHKLDTPPIAGNCKGNNPFAVTLPLTLLVSQSQASYSGKVSSLSADMQSAASTRTPSANPDSTGSTGPTMPTASLSVLVSGADGNEHAHGYHSHSSKSGRRRGKKLAGDFNSNHSDFNDTFGETGNQNQNKNLMDECTLQIDASQEATKPQRRRRGPRGRGIASKTAGSSDPNSVEIFELKRQLNYLLQENRQLRENSSKSE
eukprot:gnl/MRDRNA2_/MRDRNA2_151155_c0_seq1.p1 gnl/MRDRNA2_/MRDRNA2_151155_c0~~gnl/MRDRNA2_/MRDRNA2_151155_c0_seq1.p1  ORF type:complete len:682 (-),score=74.58 gnl/MRDRNA2_/MRDRNA2_151155_c0_seq1:505-2550(-)